MPQTADIFNPLLNAIRETGQTVLPFYYDWRQDPRIIAGRLKSFIDESTTVNEKVHIIGYSLGGLVGRAYIEKYHNYRLAKFVSVGTPFQGALSAYPAWEGDKIVGDNKQWNYFSKVLLRLCRNINKKEENIIKKIIFFPWDMKI